MISQFFSLGLKYTNETNVRTKQKNLLHLLVSSLSTTTTKYDV